MKKDTTEYKKELEKELKVLEDDLKSIGRKNPSHPTDWEPTVTKMDTDHADENEVADALDSFEENTAIMSKLEPRYNEVKEALRKIADGSFGKCTTCGKDIEEERLIANPAATTCIQHMGK